MKKGQKPAIDGAIAPRNVTRDGQPMSYNRAPSPDLSPWIARLYATRIDVPDDYRLECGLFNDTSVIRIQLSGRWQAQTRDGLQLQDRAALFFGPQSRRMPISVTGSFLSVGVSLRPGTGHALRRLKTADYVDRAVPCDALGLPSDVALHRLDQCREGEDYIQALEAMIRRIVEDAGGERPDPLTSRFEALAFSDPTMPVADFARDCGVDQRRLERIVRRDFGMPPKQVLRRARALDMASHLRGVADQAEAEELALRYYDQSHLIREFTELFGMSPRQFVATPQPLLTAALESRQSRRLEAIARLAPGERRPWE